MEEIVVPGGIWERLQDLGVRKGALAAAGVVALAVMVGALALFARGAPAQIAPPAVAEDPAELGAPTPGAAVLFVHVSGAVVTPGLYEFPEGARVADAIESAGGARRRADLDALNLAELLVDGGKVHVPVEGEVAQASGEPVFSEGEESVVSLNTADQAALESIPGIGPVKAQAIIQHREQIGGFSSISQLLEVTGIGPATLESMRPYISL
jgi:competence protein ComEA